MVDTPANPLNLPWPSNYKVADFDGPICWAPSAQLKFNLSWKDMYTYALPGVMPRDGESGENGEFVRVAEADCLMLSSVLGKYKGADVGEMNEEGEEAEVWALMKKYNLGEEATCETEFCGKPACALWYVLGDPTQQWKTCAGCQDKDFGGWPEGME